MSSRTAPWPPGRSLTQCTRPRTSGAASAGAAENPTRAALAGPASRLPCRRPAHRSAPCSGDAFVRRQLVGNPLHDERDAQLRGSLGVVAEARAESRPIRQPGALRPDHRGAVPDVERLGFAPSLCTRIVPSVNTPSTSNSSSLRCRASIHGHEAQIICVRHRSCRWMTPSTHGRRRRR